MSKITWRIENGRLGKEPEISYNDDNNAMARLSVAVNRRKYNKEEKEWEDVGITTWMNLVAFGYEAERIEMMELQKGDMVFAEGIMYQVEYEDKDNDLVIDWNYYINHLFPIPKVFSEDDDSRSSNRRKRKKKLKKRSSRSSKSSSKRSSKKQSRSSNKKGSSKTVNKVIQQLKNKRS